MFLEVISTAIIFKYSHTTSLALYLSLLSEPSTLQVLVEAAQHMIRCSSHFWVVAT